MNIMRILIIKLRFLNVFFSSYNPATEITLFYAQEKEKTLKM